MIDPESVGLEVSHDIGGDEVVVRCPFHDDNKPSAEFNRRTGLFYCFVCGVGKTARDLAVELGGTLTEGGEKKTERKEPDTDWRTRFLMHGLAVGNDYLISRQVPEIAIRKLSIRAFDEGIVFPMFANERGDICGVQVRYFTRSPKYVFYGERPPIYPAIALGSPDRVILVEGVFSVIRGRSAGFNVFATLGSAALSPALRIFFDRTRVVGMFDPDAAGYTAMAKLAAAQVPCVKVPFEADERSTNDWKWVVNDPESFTMDVGYFVGKAVAAGASPKTIAKQILKFEKEHNNA